MKSKFKNHLTNLKIHFLKSNRQNQFMRGMSLVEVMVSLGLVGAVGIGITQIILSGMKGSKTTQANIEVSTIGGDIRDILTSPLSCTQSLLNIVPSAGPQNIEVIKQWDEASGAYVDRFMTKTYAIANAIDVNSTLVRYGQGGAISITSMTVDIQNTPTNREVYLQINLDKGAGTLAQVTSERILLHVDGLNSQAITHATNKCKSVATYGEHIWKYNINNMNEIYYNMGAVGVGPGTENPDDNFDLHVGANGLRSDANSQINGNLKSGPLTVSGNMQISGSLAVSGTTRLMQNVQIMQNAQVGGLTNIGGNTNISGNMTSGGALQANAGATFTGSLSAAGGAFSVSSGGSVTGVHFTATSDIRLKSNLKPIENSLDNLSHIHGYEYSWKNDPSKKSLGVIAQDLLKIYPELVERNPQTSFYSVDYNGLVAVLINSLNELNKNVGQLEILLKAKQKEIDQLKIQISSNQKATNKNKMVPPSSVYLDERKSQAKNNLNSLKESNPSF